PAKERFLRLAIVPGRAALDDRRLGALVEDEAALEPEPELPVLLRGERPLEELRLHPEPEQELAADAAAKLDPVSHVGRRRAHSSSSAASSINGLVSTPRYVISRSLQAFSCSLSRPMRAAAVYGDSGISSSPNVFLNSSIIKPAGFCECEKKRTMPSPT